MGIKPPGSSSPEFSRTEALLGILGTMMPGTRKEVSQPSGKQGPFQVLRNEKQKLFILNRRGLAPGEPPPTCLVAQNAGLFPDALT